jgi:hypothetical protein
MVFGKHYDDMFSDWYVFYSNDNRLPRWKESAELALKER